MDINASGTGMVATPWYIMTKKMTRKKNKLFCITHLTVAASSSMDSHIRLWDLDNGKQIKSIDSGPGKNKIIFWLRATKQPLLKVEKNISLAQKEFIKFIFYFFSKLIHGQ